MTIDQAARAAIESPPSIAARPTAGESGRRAVPRVAGIAKIAPAEREMAGVAAAM